MKSTNFFKFFYLPLSTICGATAQDSRLKFVVIAKDTADPYFLEVLSGCEEKAAELNVTCIFDGPNATDSSNQTSIIYKHIAAGNVLGIAISVIDDEFPTLLPAIDWAVEVGVDVVTYDNDAPGSKRRMFIGSDNVRFGGALGKILMQVSPEGGRYGIVAANFSNINLRVEGIRKQLDPMQAFRSKWRMVEDSLRYIETTQDVKKLAANSLEQMRNLVEDHGVKAILCCCGWPMYDKVEWKKFRNQYKDIKLIIGDSETGQLTLFNQGYGDGLVGQLPHMMGALAIEILASQSKKKVDYQTGLLQYVSIPLTLRELKIDHKRIGRMVWLGYSFFAIIFVLSIGFSAWVIVNIRHRVVMASQPLFLIPLCFGTLVLGSAIIPMTIEDDGDGDGKENTPPQACMSIPWLLCTGFTLIFSMLFSKTWRVNQIFRHSQQLKRIVIKERDVILPFTVLMITNIIMLTCWTLLAPLEYVRVDLPGTDEWNRVIATAGYCSTTSTTNITPFWAILVFVNVFTLVIANVQAFQARSIEIEFSEGKYILLVVMIILQAILIGGPVLFMSVGNPQAFFTVGSMLIFVTCVTTLVCIFVPKIKLKRKMDAKIDGRVKKGHTNGVMNHEVSRKTTEEIVSPILKTNVSNKDGNSTKGNMKNACEESELDNISSGEEDAGEVMMSFGEMLAEMQNDCLHEEEDRLKANGYKAIGSDIERT